MNSRIIGRATAVLLLTIAMPAAAQWIQSGSAVNTTDSSTTEVAVVATAGGVNFKASPYTAFGALYASGPTVIGHNVGASTSTTSPTSQMVYLQSSATVGGAAISLSGANGIEFHTVAGPSTQGNVFSSPRMLLAPNGYLGIGTTGAPGHRLDVNGDARLSGAYPALFFSSPGWGLGWIQAGVTHAGGANGPFLMFRAPGDKSFLFDRPLFVNSNVAGVGATLHIAQSGTAMATLARDPSTGVISLQALEAGKALRLLTNGAVVEAPGLMAVGPAGGDATTRFSVNGSASITGNLSVNGNLAAKYQDVAEWVPATADLEAGTVVVLNPGAVNEVMASTSAYDTTVAGVVSQQPGLILGEAGATKEQIATTGRVKVKVDATRRPVRVGDLLVTGERAGTAMVSEPIQVAGIAMHRPGTIVGKALEPLAGGVGEVLVLLSLQERVLEFLLPRAQRGRRCARARTGGTGRYDVRPCVISSSRWRCSRRPLNFAPIGSSRIDSSKRWSLMTCAHSPGSCLTWPRRAATGSRSPRLSIARNASK